MTNTKIPSGFPAHQLSPNQIPLLLLNNSGTLDAANVVKDVADVRLELDADGINGLSILVAPLSVGVEPDSLAAAITLAVSKASVIVLDDLVTVGLKVISTDDTGTTTDRIDRVSKAACRVVICNIRDTLKLEGLDGVDVHAADLLLRVPADGLALGVICDAGLDTVVDVGPELVAGVPTTSLVTLVTLGAADRCAGDLVDGAGGVEGSDGGGIAAQGNGVDTRECCNDGSEDSEGVHDAEVSKRESSFKNVV